MEATLTLLPSDTKRDLLTLIKQQGAISLDDAEAATGLTRTTLREHLSHLERDGLVQRSTRKQGQGRPSLRYRLTERGGQLFPRRDSVLLSELLGFLQQQNRHDLIEAFFELFWEVRTRNIERQLSQFDPEDEAGRLGVLESALRQEGFMPEISYRDDVLVLCQCNCPFSEAVKKTRLPCQLEVEFFERILEARIERVSYIPEGHPACTYECPAWKGDNEKA